MQSLTKLSEKYEFYVMKKERPTDAVYWDMREERLLKENIAALEQRTGASK